MTSNVGIGIYIGEDEIRAVKLRRVGQTISLQRMGASPTPKGAMSGGALHDAKLLAEGIRGVLKGYDISGSTAMVSLPGRTATSRVLTLPKMNEEELRPVVIGEMEHYRMIPPGQGAFGYVRLGRNGEETPEDGQIRLLLMAADKRIVDSYREAVRQAGLQMDLLEPYSFAAARAAYPELKKGGVALIAVDARSTELLVFDEGALSYSRQIDIGALDITGEKADAKDQGPRRQEAEGATADAKLPQLGTSRNDLQSLLFEVQRSIEFYHREVPDAARIERIVLCADLKQLGNLDKHLQESVGIPVAMAKPFEGLRYNDSHFKADDLSEQGPCFAPAVGLALKALGEAAEAPGIDLSVTGKESRLEKSAPKRLAVALGISLVLVVAAIFSAFYLRGVMRERQNTLNQTKVELAEVAQTAEEKSEMARRVKEAQEIVQMRGLPWYDILSEVAQFMPERSWLSDIRSDRMNMLSLEGGAISADSVANLMDSLIDSELFGMPRPIYVQKDESRARPTVKFRIELAVTQPADIEIPTEETVKVDLQTAPSGEEE